MPSNHQFLVTDIKLDAVPGNRIVDYIVRDFVTARKEAIINDVKKRRFSSVASTGKYVDTTSFEIHVTCFAAV